MARVKNDDVFPSAAKLRELSEDELRVKLDETRKELVLSRFKHASARLERVSDLKNIRRTIARMETVLAEKQRA